MARRQSIASSQSSTPQPPGSPGELAKSDLLRECLSEIPSSPLGAPSAGWNNSGFAHTSDAIESQTAKDQRHVALLWNVIGACHGESEGVASASKRFGECLHRLADVRRRGADAVANAAITETDALYLGHAHRLCDANALSELNFIRQSILREARKLEKRWRTSSAEKN